VSSRPLDLAASLVALAGFAPVLAGAALAIRLEDGGPVFFRQERVGRDRRPFLVLKLRTMRDGQVTRVGRWLRATGIDEVPQFWNVLRGDMSVVGPRPLTEADVQRLGWGEHGWRFAVKPGITGPAQLWSTGAEDSLRWDRTVVEGRGLRGDLRLIGLSFVVNVVGKKRVRRWTARSGRPTAA
jgi:lipopolysaccharide/colanic/teichoic acid biosynthesis glycosyltransferase